MTNRLKLKSVYKPLATAALLLGVCAAAFAQAQKSTAPAGGVPPRFEIGAFGGGQWWSLSNGNKPKTDSLVGGALGGIRATQDFTSHFGFEEAYTIYAVNNIRFINTQPYPVQTLGVGARNYQVYVGPVVYFNPRESRVRVFLTVGPAYQGFWPTNDSKSLVKSPAYQVFHAQQLQSRGDVALVYGGGVKFNMSERFGIRFDVRGIFTKNPHFNLPSYSTGLGSVYIPTGGIVNGLQTTAGVYFRFGAIPPPPPAPAPPPPAPTVKDATVSLAADQTDVCPGTPVKITATTNIASDVTYQWRVNGQPADGTNVLNFDTNGKQGGSYSIGVTVRAPGYNEASATTSVTLKDYQQPTGTVTASPSTIPVGGTSSITSTFNGQCGGTIKPATCTASEGSISGDTFNSNGVQFDANNAEAQSKSVTITCTTTDEKGGTGTATTTVTVTKAANPQAVRLPDIVFAPGSSRVNNCGKRVLLEQLKTYLDRDPTGRVVFVGHDVEKEPHPKGVKLDQARALNAAAIISAGKGICLGFNPAQILISAEGTNQEGVDFQPNFCGTSATKERRGQAVSESDPNAKYRRVEVYFVPTNAQPPSTAKDLKDATSLDVAKLGCPK